MNAWNYTASAQRTRSRLVARLVIAATVVGEGIALYHSGVHADFITAYLIVSAWTKDAVHKVFVENGATLSVNDGVAPLTA